MTMGEKTIAIVLGGLGVMVTIGAVFYVGSTMTYAIMSAAPQENEARVNKTVHAVCSYSRDIQDYEAEKACGIAQDVSMTEYLCPSADSPNQDCFVEDKRNMYETKP